jgi:integrase
VEGSKIADGLPAKVIQERLGHATMAETMDTYGHLFPGASEHGRSALDAMFAPAGVRPMCARQRS